VIGACRAAVAPSKTSFPREVKLQKEKISLLLLFMCFLLIAQAISLRTNCWVSTTARTVQQYTRAPHNNARDPEETETDCRGISRQLHIIFGFVIDLSVVFFPINAIA
jgi:hypothetical protein